MPNTAIIVVVIVIFVLLIGGGILYYYYRKPSTTISTVTPPAPVTSPTPAPGSTVSTVSTAGGTYTPTLTSCTPNKGEGCIVSSLTGNTKITGQYKIQPGESITTLTVGPYTGAQIYGDHIYDFVGSEYSNSTSTLDFRTVANIHPTTISIVIGTPPPSARPATPAPTSSSTPAPVSPTTISPAPSQSPHLSLGSSF